MATHLISVRVRDDGGKPGNVKVFVPDSLTIAQVQAYVNAMLPNLDVVTGGKIEAAGVRLALSLPGGLKANAIADHPIAWGANFGFSAAGTVYRHTIYVPAIDQGLVDAGELDTTDPLITAWVADIVTGDGTVAPSDEYENDLTALLAGSTTFHKP